MININTHGADIDASDATVTCHGIQNIEAKQTLAKGRFVEIETIGGTVEFCGLPDDLIDALCKLNDLIHT